MVNKKEDIRQIIEKYKPMVLGLGEAQVIQNHEIADIQQAGYTLHLDGCQPSLGVSRCAVFTHNSLVVKRRHDLEDPGIATVWLQLGHPKQKGVLLMCGYRQWRLPGQLDGGAASCIIPAQRQRWGMILTQWEKALEEEREVICAMDANIDALSWFSDSNDKLTPLVNDLFERIIPQGISQLFDVPTHAQQGIATKCLDHIYTTNPEKLSEVTAEFTGMSDHKLIKISRYTKSLKQSPRYVRKRCFKNFNKEDFKQKVREMPELGEILECQCANQAADLLTSGLTRVLDVCAPIKNIQN